MLPSDDRWRFFARCECDRISEVRAIARESARKKTIRGASQRTRDLRPDSGRARSSSHQHLEQEPSHILRVANSVEIESEGERYEIALRAVAREKYPKKQLSTSPRRSESLARAITHLIDSLPQVDERGDRLLPPLLHSDRLRAPPHWSLDAGARVRHGSRARSSASVLVRGCLDPGHEVQSLWLFPRWQPSPPSFDQSPANPNREGHHLPAVR